MFHVKHLAGDPASSTNDQHPYVSRSEHHQLESNRWHEDITGSIELFHVERHAASHGLRRDPAHRGGVDDVLPAWVGAHDPLRICRPENCASAQHPHPQHPLTRPGPLLQ